MTTKAIQTQSKPASGAVSLENALLSGDLSSLSSQDRILYYQRTCESLGLNPLTKPFEYIKLNGKLTLYARKDATDQLRNIHGVSIDKPDIQQIDNLIIVTVTAKDSKGRSDSDIGVVPKNDMGGNLSNALMKAVTKAKRRVTLSICGLGMLDETEIETIPNAQAFSEPENPKQIKEPEPVEDGGRAAAIAELQDLCKQLNDAGDDVKWTGKKLNEYINDLFSVEDGIASLSAESFETVIEDLKGRLVNVQNKEEF